MRARALPSARLAAALVAATISAAAIPAAPGAARASDAPGDLVRAELVAEPAAIRPGEPFEVGVRLTMRPHWHTYWRNPGDSGLATEIAWTLPAGFAAGPILWPVPERIPVTHLVNYGYEGEALLRARITPPTDLAPGASVPLRATVSYLVCERECVPGEAEVALDLPAAGAAGRGSPADPAHRALFEAARAGAPVPSPWPTRVTSGGGAGGLALRLDAPDLPAAVTGAAFLPYGETVIDHAAPQVFARDAGGFTLALTPSALAGTPPTRLDGLLVLEEGGPGRDGARRAYAIGEEPAAPARAEAPTRGEAAPAAAAPVEDVGLWAAVLLALAGGLVLNLMPCVFPVLSIKVLGLVRHSGESARRVRLHGLAYAAGVLAAFLGLAAILFAVRAGGAQVGWGFQLQSPVVVALLAYFLLAMGLNLSGVFHLGGGRLAGLGDGLARRDGLEGSFFTGLLASLVATPCTAPFMGAAVGYALTQGPAAGLLVFGALGLGLALPFLALTAFPGALARLPRPGAWMETLKQVLAFPLYATAAWLVWVLSQQVGPTGLFAALLGLVLVGFAAWAYDRAGAGFAGSGMGWGARAALAAALVALGLAGGTVVVLERDRGWAAPREAAGTQAFTQARLDALLDEGRPVFVNMTAAWCITCLVNERAALGSASVRAALAARDVAYLKGDWTNQNPEITRVLERHGRSGVPLYLVFPGRGAGGGARREAVVLPQILTEAAVLDAIESAAPEGARRRAAALETPPR